jgi:hypothetical protein
LADPQALPRLRRTSLPRRFAARAALAVALLTAPTLAVRGGGATHTLNAKPPRRPAWPPERRPVAAPAVSAPCDDLDRMAGGYTRVPNQPSPTTEGDVLPANDSEPPFHLLLEPHEIGVTAKALNLLITDEAHEPQIRTLARDVIAQLDGAPDEHAILSVELSSRQMKITHTALRSLYRDLGRDEADELELLRTIIDKLPDEHTMRAISLD